VAIDANHHSFRHYNGTYVYGLPGVEECSEKPEDTNHAVVAVGYGQTTIEGKLIKYFIVQNSYGVHWGSEGYGAIYAGDEESDTGGCGILTNAFAVGVW